MPVHAPVSSIADPVITGAEVLLKVEVDNRIE